MDALYQPLKETGTVRKFLRVLVDGDRNLQTNKNHRGTAQLRKQRSRERLNRECEGQSSVSYDGGADCIPGALDLPTWLH